jgi:UDP-N-acetyl-D-mannosaminuronic acid transferase (WecB/TagA/CpsF family)
MPEVVEEARGAGLLLGVKLRPEVVNTEMQAAGVEWLHRLLSEPRRLWRRYLIDGPAILPILLADRRSRRRAAPVR